MLYTWDFVLCNPATSLHFSWEFTALVPDTDEMPFTVVETNNKIAQPLSVLLLSLNSFHSTGKLLGNAQVPHGILYPFLLQYNHTLLILSYSCR